MEVLRDGGVTGGFHHQLMLNSLCSQLRMESSCLILGRRRVPQVSSDLDYLISSSNASALFLKTPYSVYSCSIALELDQKKQETNCRFPTFYLYIYTHT